MRSYAYYSMMALTGAYGYNHYDLSDVPAIELYQIPKEELAPEVNVAAPKRSLLRILLSLISFKHF